MRIRDGKSGVERAEPKSTRERTCIGCGKKGFKGKFIRIVRSTDGRIFLDPKGNSDGRGAYVCRDNGCFERAMRKRALNRSFRIDVSEDIVKGLIEAWDRDIAGGICLSGG